MLGLWQPRLRLQHARCTRSRSAMPLRPGSCRHVASLTRNRDLSAGHMVSCNGCYARHVTDGEG